MECQGEGIVKTSGKVFSIPNREKLFLRLEILKKILKVRRATRPQPIKFN